jgi:hypothetical protein
MLTPSTGAKILDGIAVGQTFSQTYSKTLEDIWVAEDMEIIAFVSLVNGSDFPVLQAASVHLAE